MRVHTGSAADSLTKPGMALVWVKLLQSRVRWFLSATLSQASHIGHISAGTAASARYWLSSPGQEKAECPSAFTRGSGVLPSPWTASASTGPQIQCTMTRKESNQHPILFGDRQADFVLPLSPVPSCPAHKISETGFLPLLLETCSPFCNSQSRRVAAWSQDEQPEELSSPFGLHFPECCYCQHG